MKILVTGGLGYIGSHTVVQTKEITCVVIHGLSSKYQDYSSKIYGTQKEVRFFTIERDVLKKKLAAFHKLCREYRSIHG